MSDYPTALSTANSLDSRIQADASKISSDYADLVALSVRQAFGATEVTAGKGSGGLNADDILVFMKGAFKSAAYVKIEMLINFNTEISSDGVSFALHRKP
jgi:hypothetical protein